MSKMDKTYEVIKDMPWSGVGTRYKFDPSMHKWINLCGGNGDNYV